jgi:hypothetical protein
MAQPANSPFRGSNPHAHDGLGSPALTTAEAGPPCAGSWAGSDPAARSGLWRLPDGPARRRWRATTPEATGHSRARSRRHRSSTGERVECFAVGDRIGVPWLGHTCGTCSYCRSERENLCDNPGFTGYTLDGGYAEYALADFRYCFPIPDRYGDAEAAPLLCAGLIGYRSLVMAGDGRRLGIYGFGAAAHIITQVARFQGREVYAFTRPGDVEAQQFARELGAVWTGDSTQAPPEELDAAMTCSSGLAGTGSN